MWAKNKLSSTDGLCSTSMFIITGNEFQITFLSIYFHYKLMKNVKTNHKLRCFDIITNRAWTVFNIERFCKKNLTHSRVQVSNVACYAISVGDLDMLMWARVNHHVPWVAIQPICPVIIALFGPEIKCLTFKILLFFIQLSSLYNNNLNKS